MGENYSSLDAALLVALPTEVHHALTQWQEKTKCKLHLVSTLNNGFTEALVAVVTANDEVGGRKIVLKAAHGQAANEARAHDAALQNAPADFARSRLVTQEYEPLQLENDWFVMFQGVAGGGLNDYKPLSIYSRRTEIRGLMVTIATSVVHEWNPSPTVHDVTVIDFLESHVGRKLTKGGGVRDWAATNLGAGVDQSPYLQFEPRTDLRSTVMNPFTIWNDEHFADVNIHALMGKIHGDLHQENVLVNVKEGAREQGDYRLIDLATYKDEAPLSRDFTNLFASEVEQELPHLNPEARSDLLRVLPSEQRNVTSEIAAIVRLWDEIRPIVDQESSARGLRDDWRIQVDLSLAGAALQSASRSHRDTTERLWFFELAARLIHKVFENLNLLPGTEATAHLIEVASTQPRPEVEAAAVAVASACGQFSGECLTIALIDGTDHHRIHNPKFSAWDVIIDFDPFSDRGGLFEAATKFDTKHRWFAENDGTIAKTVSTLWIPGISLASPSGFVPDMSLRQWRSSRLLEIRRAIQDVISSHPGSVTVVQFDEPGSRMRAVVESIVDIAGDRAELVVVSQAGETELADLDPIRHIVDPIQTLLQLPARPSSRMGEGAVVTIPGGAPGERVPLNESSLNWYADVGDLLHSEVESAFEEEERLEGDFYLGRKISWLELAEGRDIPRKAMLFHKEKIEHRMSQRGTYRETLKHVPGSGGTTVARRLAWELHYSHPVLVIEEVRATGPLVERISALAELTRRQCVVLLEQASDAAATDLYNQLTARSTPVTLIIVSRRNSQFNVDASKGVGPLSRAERAEFTRVFSALAIDAKAKERISGIGLPGGDPAVPFFYALNAFQANYEGLAPFVAASVAQHRDAVRSSIADISLVHRFARKALPARVISVFQGAPYQNNQAVRKNFSNLAENLLLEEPLGSWRTSHTLVADELVKQLLGSLEGAVARDWKNDLFSRSRDLIVRISEAYPDVVPDAVLALLRSLFIERDSHEELDAAPRALFSELVKTIPTYSEREELFAALNEYFPDQSHFMAHHARLRSYQGKDYSGARRLIDSALEISPRDANIANIKGVVVRNEIYRNLDTNPQAWWSDDIEYRTSLNALIREALNCFIESEKLEGGRTEHNAVLIVSMAVRLVSRLKPRDLTLGQFLTKPSSTVLAESLDEAEEAVGRIEEIAGDASLSDRVEGVLTDYRGVREDNPESLLQGWRNILDTTRGHKGPIRSRLARLYWDKSNNGRDVNSAKKAFDMLNENLRDDPYDARSIRLWLQVGRHVGATLDQAAIHCARWVEVDRGRQSLYYDWVVSALLCLDGRLGERPNYERKLDLLRAAGRDMRNFRDVFEWVGHGEGLGKLINAKDPRLDRWDRKDKTTTKPGCIRRTEARVKKITARQSGWLRLDHGLDAFFTPHASGLQQGKDEEALVTAVMGLTHDGLVAWSVDRQSGKTS